MVNAPKKRIRFERHPSQVVFDPSSSSFVVTWSKCGIPNEKRLEKSKDPISWTPSVSAIAELYDRGCVQQCQIVYAAMAVGKAFDAGDRVGLDTDGAKKAAELVRDLALMCVDVKSGSVARDVGQAMRHLIDEMSKVRFLNCEESELEDSIVLKPLEKATRECLSIEGFCNWPKKSMRRRFLFCLNRKERTQASYTLVSLLFDSGPCPLLTLSDRRAIRMKAMKESGIGSYSFSKDSFMTFFSIALSEMRNAKSSGMSSLSSVMTQQQLADSVGSSS